MSLFPAFSKEFLEWATDRLETATYGFTLFAAVSGVLYLLANKPLKRILASESAAAQKRLDDNEEQSKKLQKEIASANERAAELGRQAEADRLARIKLEARMAWRRITKEQHDQFVSALLPHAAGALVTLSALGDLEAETFANDLVKVLRDAGWRVDVTRSGLMSPPPYGLQATVSAENNGTKPLVDVLRLLPGAIVRSAPNLQGATADILVGLKPPP